NIAIEAESTSGTWKSKLGGGYRLNGERMVISSETGGLRARSCEVKTRAHGAQKILSEKKKKEK
ncbi:hypothetical protein K0M31_015642, partial [Melipona bicolor]